MLSESEADAIREFIRNYCENEVAALCQGWPDDKDTLEIEYMDLFRADIYDDRNAADVLTKQPDEVIEDIRCIAAEYDYPVNMDIEPTVRIAGSEYTRTVEQLRQEDVGNYVTVRGQVNELTQVEPKPVTAVFKCRNCSNSQEVLQHRKTFLTPSQDCQLCEKGYMGWELDDQATTWQDHQIIELAALPEDTGGQAPDKIKVEVINDLAGAVSPGDRVQISGVVKTETEDIHTKQNPNIRRPMYLDGRAIQNEQESFAEIEPSRIDEIKELAGRETIYTDLVESFAPHIHTASGGNQQKLAIILALFGGVQKQLPTGSQIRGNINVLLIGDGGTAKSQFLKTAGKLAPKSVLASGKGATAAGLTATAEQSNLTGEWSLKAGALVMANNGVACIDEFDKMDGSARKSIHEALENQEVPVTKAGINTTLPAKTAVIAAANPDGGEFNRFDDLTEQIDMEQPLVSRFDIIFGLKDTQDEDRDATIATTQHDVAAGEFNVEPAIEYELLREYIAYARQIEPTYADDDVKERLVDYYVQLRKDAENGDEPGPRHNDSLRRIAQASARVRLSEDITMEDAERAIDMFKYTIGQVGLDEDGNVSGGQLDGGYSPPTSQKERRETVKTIVNDADGPVSMQSIRAQADEKGVDPDKAESDIDHWMHKGEMYEPQTNHYNTT